MSNVEYQVSNINKVKLLSERTSGVPPVIFIMECHRTNTDTNINDIQYPEYAKCFFKGQGIQGYIYIFNQLPNTNNLAPKTIWYRTIW